MNDEKLEGSGVLGDCDVGSSLSVGTAGLDLAPASNDNLTPDPRLKPGVPVEDIPGLDEAKARELGLLKTPEDYAAERQREILELESFDHVGGLESATTDLVHYIMQSLSSVQALGNVTNKSYGKFMALGMEPEAEYLVGLQANLHFNKLIELLQEAKARAVLLNVELTNF